jgi:hypothetical protein
MQFELMKKTTSWHAFELRDWPPSPFVDPVNGIPLTVVRTYNSLNPRAGDFGVSWTYALNSMDGMDVHGHTRTGAARIRLR